MRIRALLLLLALFVAGATVAQAQTRVNLSFFYDSLTPYGDWVVSASYGNVFRPHVAVGWRPYVAGHWAYCDYGWTWISDEDWGWATYHYGRWYYDPVYGWCWVPGYDWAPAWVDWQWGDGWIGWAPLPPQVGWTGFGLRVGGQLNIAPAAFVFVPERSFLDPRLRYRVIDPARNAVLLRSTRNVTRYAVVNRTVAIRSLPVDEVQRFTGRAVPRYQVVSSTVRANPRVRGNRLLVYRPQVSRSRPIHPPALSHRRDARPPAVTRMRIHPQRVVTSRPEVRRAFTSPPPRRNEIARLSPATRMRSQSHVVPSHPAIRRERAYPSTSNRMRSPSHLAARQPASRAMPTTPRARRPEGSVHPVSPKAAHRVQHPKRAHPNGGKPPGG